MTNGVKQDHLNDAADETEASLHDDERISDEVREALQEEAATQEDNAIAEPVAAIVAENEDLKDRLLRLAAELENLRRRGARDVADARSYAISNFARDMVSVADNMARALEAIPEEARNSEDAGFKALIDGVEMTGRDMHAALERHGVKKLTPEGEKFDPNFHQAMFEVPNTEIANNTVVQVVQAGYVIGERVLRPAMVGVSRGGPKHAPANANTDDTPPGAEPPDD